MGISINWASYNVGAVALDQYGSYHSWNDAVNMEFEGDWRLPMQVEIQELLDNCTSTPTSVEGVAGMRFTSKKEGYTDCSIFIPVAGRYDGSTGLLVGYAGYCWSSTKDDESNGRARSLSSSSSGAGVSEVMIQPLQANSSGTLVVGIR